MKNFIGQDGFIWWIGKVVDLDDPLSIGRCRVRIFGYHGEERDVPNSDLPWAVAIHPVNTPNFYGTPRVGDFVFGFFLDATSAQEPAMLGYFPYSEPGGNKSFSSITSKEDILLDINGAKIEIAADGNIFFTSKNVERISLETIVTKINDAQRHANGAFDKANTVVNELGTLNNKVDVVYDFANTTSNVVTVSYSTANQAFSVANISFDVATDAFDKANGAFNTANGAFIHANSAFDHANGAFDKGNTALAISFVL